MRVTAELKKTVLKTDREGDSFAEVTLVMRLDQIGLDGISELGRMQGEVVAAILTDTQLSMEMDR